MLSTMNRLSCAGLLLVLGTEFNLVDEGGASLRNLAAKLPEDSWPDFKVRAR